MVGIVADPIEHVRTPQAFNALMTACACDTVMVPFHVGADGLPPLMAAARAIRSLLGLVVTIPHKEAIVDHCTSLTPAAMRARAANVVRFDRAAGQVVGTNTDGAGFLAGLAAQGYTVTGRRVFLAGAGGAASAIAEALAEVPVAALGVWNRTQARAEALVERLRAGHTGLDAHLADPVPAGYDIAINATALGLRADDPLPFHLDRLAPPALVAEVVMSTDLTPLLAAAQARGHPVHFGRHMLAGQMAEIARFLGVAGDAP